MSETVSLLDLAAACVAVTTPTAQTIREIAESTNSRLKADGSVVTDADYAAQTLIVTAVQLISNNVRIIGEEDDALNTQETANNDTLTNKMREDIWKPLHDAAKNLLQQRITLETTEVEANRIRVIVDPLDGTKSYAQGEYDCVSILIAIVLDNDPIFGVIGKPYGFNGVQPHDQLVTIYGGTMIGGVYVDNSDIKPETEALPRAVISSSRGGGEIEEFCKYLSQEQMLHEDLHRVSGAGEKTLWVIFARENAGLWFYPKPGTFRWDVAAPDALLRAMGGRLTDQHGKLLDYQTLEELENVNGVVCARDADLHKKCVEVYQEWKRNKD